jgi:hypothetical protein
MNDRIPIGSRSRSKLLLCTLVAWVGAASGGCLSNQPAKGDLAIEVYLPQAVAVRSLTYQIEGNGIQPITEVALIQGAPTSASALFSGLPAGNGYAVEISAVGAESAIGCSASATTEVLAATTTNLFVPLQCRSPPNGNAAVTAMFASCSQISSFAVAPVVTSVGGTIGLTAQSSDVDGAATIYLWAASSGTISVPAAPETSFTCLTAGPSTISLTVSNGSCADHQSVTVTCVPTTP